MESFYGGRQGTPFLIKASFKTVNEMNVAFSNKDYTTVRYGEYCIIDTVNKNHKDNGKIYRRVVNGTGNIEDGSPRAEFIGQIVGPSGGTAMIQIGGLSEVNDKYDAEIEARNNITDVDEKDLYQLMAYEDINGQSTFVYNGENTATDLTVFATGTGEIDLVPGKDGDKFNDVVRYSWFNVRKPEFDPNSENDEGLTETFCQIGFEIPYTITDFVVEPLPYYGNDNIGGVKIEQLPDDEEGNEHPFYNKWKFSIPRGIPGSAVKNIYKDTWNGITTATENKTIYNFADLVYNTEAQRYEVQDSTFTLASSTIHIMDEEDENGNLVEKEIAHIGWFCDIELHDLTTTTRVYTFFINFAEEIATTSVDLNTGLVTFYYTDGATSNDNIEGQNYQMTLNFIEDIIVTPWPDRYLLIKYTGMDDPEFIPPKDENGNVRPLAPDTGIAAIADYTGYYYYETIREDLTAYGTVDLDSLTYSPENDTPEAQLKAIIDGLNEQYGALNDPNSPYRESTLYTVTVKDVDGETDVSYLLVQDSVSGEWSSLGSLLGDKDERIIAQVGNELDGWSFHVPYLEEGAEPETANTMNKGAIRYTIPENEKGLIDSGIILATPWK